MIEPPKRIPVGVIRSSAFHSGVLELFKLDGMGETNRSDPNHDIT